MSMMLGYKLQQTKTIKCRKLFDSHITNFPYCFSLLEFLGIIVLFSLFLANKSPLKSDGVEDGLVSDIMCMAKHTRYSYTVGKIIIC